MELESTQRIPAPRAAVWAAIHDPEVLRRCIPGCEEVERVSDSEMTAKVVLKIGPVKASFRGKVMFENVVEPESLTLSGEGAGGVAGHAKGAADVTLAEEDGETVLSYTVRAQVGGKIAQLGSRLIEGTAKKLSAQFFSKLEAEFAPDPA